MEIQQNLEKSNDVMTIISKVADTALDFGLKAILPDFIEDDIIEIKDKFMQEGFAEGINEVVEKLEDTGKSIKGIFTGDFENIGQIKKIIEKDGLLDGISEVIDKILKRLLDKKVIKKDVYTLIKNGKKEILSSIENELEGLYKEDTYSLEKLSQYCEEWKEHYKEKNYEEMAKTMKKINQRLTQSKLVEETIKQARDIESIQKYIEEKGDINSLSEEEKELIEKLK